jgi:hypothetical protein
MIPGLAVALVLVAGGAAPVESIGVIIVPTPGTDVALADNLNEVAMARIAETPGRTLVGTPELRARLAAERTIELAACIEQPACLSRVGVSLGVGRLVTGVVRREGGRFFLSLTLTDIAANRVQGQFFRQVDGAVGDLVQALVDGVERLLDPNRAPGRLRVRSDPEGARVTVDDAFLGSTPFLSGSLAPGPHAVRVELDRHFAWRSTVTVLPGRELPIDLGRNDLASRRIWAPYLAYGTATGAALCGATGLAFGALAQVTPSGDTRAQVQMDLERRRGYGRVGTALWISGAVLVVVSAVTLVRYWRDIVD